MFFGFSHTFLGSIAQRGRGIFEYEYSVYCTLVYLFIFSLLQCEFVRKILLHVKVNVRNHQNFVM